MISQMKPEWLGGTPAAEGPGLEAVPTIPNQETPAAGGSGLEAVSTISSQETPVAGGPGSGVVPTVPTEEECRTGWEKMLHDLTKDSNIRDSLKAGISFRASKKLDIMALMIRIPYFEVSKNLASKAESQSTQPQESFSLPEYRSLVSGISWQERDTGSSSSGEQLLSDWEQPLVHQAWFIVFGHGLIFPLIFSFEYVFWYRP